MPAKRRVDKRRPAWPTVTATQWALLRDEEPPEGGLEGDADRWVFTSDRAVDEPGRGGRRSARGLWAEHKPAILREWIAAHPGTRPSCWWRFSAPGPRQRLGGVGEPGASDMHLGIPSYGTRPVPGDRHGERELSYDLADPPVYESQATYLARHGLVLPAERRRLTAADFAPERIEIDDDELGG